MGEKGIVVDLERIPRVSKPVETPQSKSGGQPGNRNLGSRLGTGSDRQCRIRGGRIAGNRIVDFPQYPR